jgi:hypothetical protein
VFLYCISTGRTQHQIPKLRQCSRYTPLQLRNNNLLLLLMRSKKHTLYLKLLLKLTLLFGILPFAGYKGNSQFSQLPKGQIELTCSNPKKYSFKTATYSKPPKKYLSKEYQAKILLRHNELFKISFARTYTKSLSIQIMQRSTQLKRISKIYNKETLPFLLG